MAIRYENLPRDTNGIVQGAWRILHANPDYFGELGPAIFRHGESVFPVAGRPLSLLAAHFGESLYMEPWGDAPRNGWELPPCVEFDLPASITWTPEPCPWRTTAAPKAAPKLPPLLADTLPPPPPEEPTEAAAPAGDVSLDDMDRDALEALAADLGVKVDGRWGETKIRRAIRFAQR